MENQMGGIFEATFKGSEPYFEDHFPGYPLVPGVLLVEEMRKASIQWFQQNGFTVHLKQLSSVRMLRPCIPPITVQIHIHPLEPFLLKAEIRNPQGQRLITAKLLFEDTHPA